MTILIGTEGDDRLFGGDVDDSLYGLGGSDLLRGLDGGDWLEGGDGDDNLYGGAGADTLTGGAGVDILNYGDSAAGVSVNLATGATHGAAAEGDVLLDSFEIVRGSLFDDTLIGDAEDNALRGLAGDDILRGLAGADILNGGDGADLLDGGDADDILRGGRGGDSLIGGAGRDLASYAFSDAGVTIELAAGTARGGFAEGDRLLDHIEILDGSLFADSLSGSTAADALNGLDGDDTLDGDAGDDVLDGGAGADSLTGGVGNDTVDYGHSQAAVAIDLAAGTAHGGDAEGDSFGDAIEILRGSRFADTLTGDAGDDTLFGALGADTLEGGDGDDVLDGGAGADHLVGGAGIDTVSYADSPVGPTINLTTGVSTGGDAEGDMLTGIEIIEGSRLRGISVTGDDGVNILRGLGAINSFQGLGGDDVATGADYADYFYGGDGNDHLDGAAYRDGLQGGAGDDTIIGGTGNDNLYGDDLYDATGTDRFVYTSLADTTVTSDANFRERILDFSHAEGDAVDLAAIDADGDAANGDTAFTIVTGAFTGAGSELLITPVGTGRSALVRADVDGDTRTDFLVQIFVDAPLTAADFVL